MRHVASFDSVTKREHLEHNQGLNPSEKQDKNTRKVLVFAAMQESGGAF